MAPFSLRHVALFLANLRAVSAHASMIMPPPRNAIDSELEPWKSAAGQPLSRWPKTGWIEPYGCECVNGTSDCAPGQACFWFSQGCTIGCSKCDGNGARFPNFDHCPGESIKPTLHPKYRTLNQHSVPGSLQDIFKFNPWRAPGAAPVFDPCGMAGGSLEAKFNAGEYNTTKFARQGDLGSVVLPKRPSGTVWQRGNTAKTRWQYTASHAGGYQYRLCPASEPLTEACFQRNPLAFAKPYTHTIRFKNGSSVTINATVVTEGGGQGWAVNPIPSYESDYVACDYAVPAGEHCDWHCPGCGPPHYMADGACPCKCADKYDGVPQYVGADRRLFPNPLPDFDRHYHTYAVEDTVDVPSDIPPGDYVLGYRWDCEQTSQVWSSCADITIV